MWNEISIKDGKYVNAPEYDKPVLAILKWSRSGKLLPAVIKYVNADDHNWETVDDNSELSYALDVVKWMYVPNF